MNEEQVLMLYWSIGVVVSAIVIAALQTLFEKDTAKQEDDNEPK